MTAGWGTPDVGRVPLFDRLIDDELYVEREAAPRRTLDRAGLLDSVRREVERLLATRCPLRGDDALTRPRTVLDYGLPDLDQGGRGVTAEQRPRLARLVRETIEAFEPRLVDVHVEVNDPGEGKSRAVMSLEACVIIDDQRESLSFQLPLGGSGSDER